MRTKEEIASKLEELRGLECSGINEDWFNRHAIITLINSNGSCKDDLIDELQKSRACKFSL